VKFFNKSVLYLLFSKFKGRLVRLASGSRSSFSITREVNPSSRTGATSVSIDVTAGRRPRRAIRHLFGSLGFTSVANCARPIRLLASPCRSTHIPMNQRWGNEFLVIQNAEIDRGPKYTAKPTLFLLGGLWRVR
jgi:hypothetical protein